MYRRCNFFLLLTCQFLMWSSMALAQITSYDMNDAGTCGRSLSVGDSGIGLQMQGNLSPLECTVHLTLASQNNQENTGIKLQVEVESLSIMDCGITIAISNGHDANGNLLRQLGCSSQSADTFYSVGQEITVKVTVPSTVTQGNDQLSLLVTPFDGSYYCSDSPVSIRPGQSLDVHIKTRNKRNDFYAESQHCEWRVDAGSGQRVQLEVTQSDLQYAPPGSLCDGFDSVNIIDSQENLVLVSWCGNDHPDVINTEGHLVTVVFSSDSITPSTERYTRGVNLKLTSFASSECPPDWREFGSSCFKRRSTKVNWFEAQERCNLEYGNLASISTQEEYDFVKTHFNSSGKIWIGLNDVERPGTFKFIDKAISGSFSRLSSLTPNKFSHCVTVDVESDVVTVEDCETEKFDSFCRASKSQPFVLYSLPKGETNKGSGSSGRTLLLGLLIPAAILLVLILAGAFIYRRRKKMQRRNLRSRNAGTAAADARDTTRSRTPTPEITRGTKQQPALVPSAPPTYEEALCGSPAPDLNVFV